MKARSAGGPPRSTGRPEHNQVQQPELLKRLASALGLRQMHIAPALNEGIQAVVIVEDIRAIPQATPDNFVTCINPVGDTVNPPAALFGNPPGSGVVATLTGFTVAMSGPSAASDGVPELSMWHSDTFGGFAPQRGNNAAIRSMRPLFQAGVAGSRVILSKCFISWGNSARNPDLPFWGLKGMGSGAAGSVSYPPLYVPCRIVVPPNMGINWVMSGSTANTHFVLGLFWDEVPFEHALRV